MRRHPEFEFEFHRQYSYFCTSQASRVSYIIICIYTWRAIAAAQTFELLCANAGVCVEACVSLDVCGGVCVSLDRLVTGFSSACVWRRV